MFTIIFILFSSLTISYAHFTFKPVPDSTPIIYIQNTRSYVAFDSFKVLFFIDLEPLYDLVDTMEKCVEEIEHICANTSAPTCGSSSSQLRHQMQNIREDDEFLHSIGKRFILCEWCGSVDHWFSGVMDADTARHYDSVINAIKNETISNHDLLKNQSSITEAMLQYNKKTIESIEKALNNINLQTHQNQLKFTDWMNELHLRTTLNEIIQTTQLAMTEHNRFHGKIRRTITAAKEGRFTELIPRTQLTEELKHISTALKNSQKLPIDPFTDDVFRIYSLSRIQSTMYNRKILIELQIPITEREEFTLFKAIPVPVKTPYGLMIATITNTFFLLNSEHTKFIALSDKQIHNGLKLTRDEMLYRPTSPAILDEDTICEWKAIAELDFGELSKTCHFTPFADHNLLISIIENDIYFTTSPNGTRISEKCGDGEYAIHKIPARGTIHIDPDCILRTQTYIIQAHRTKRINATKIITPSFATQKLTSEQINELGIVRRLNFSTVEPIVIHNAAELSKLADETKFLVQKTNHEINIDDLSYESSNFSWLTSIISSAAFIGGAGSIVACILWRINFLKCLMNSISEHATIENDHQGMVTINLDPVKPNVYNNPVFNSEQPDQPTHQK